MFRSQAPSWELGQEDAADQRWGRREAVLGVGCGGLGDCGRGLWFSLDRLALARAPAMLT